MCAWLVSGSQADKCWNAHGACESHSCACAQKEAVHPLRGLGYVPLKDPAAIDTYDDISFRKASAATDGPQNKKHKSDKTDQRDVELVLTTNGSRICAGVWVHIVLSPHVSEADERAIKAGLAIHSGIACVLHQSSLLNLPTTEMEEEKTLLGLSHFVFTATSGLNTVRLRPSRTRKMEAHGWELHLR